MNGCSAPSTSSSSREYRPTSPSIAGLAHPEYIAGRIHTGFIDQYFKGAELLKPNAQEEETLAMLGAIAALREREQPGGAPASLLGIAAVIRRLHRSAPGSARLPGGVDRFRGMEG